MEQDLCRTENGVGLGKVKLRQVLHRIVTRDGVAVGRRLPSLGDVACKRGGTYRVRNPLSLTLASSTLLSQSLLSGSSWNQGHWVV